MHLIPATGLGLKQNSKLLDQQPQLDLLEVHGEELEEFVPAGQLLLDVAA